MSQNTFQQKERLFDRWAPNYDFIFTTVFYQAVHKRLLEYVELPKHSQVLDLGCGTGRLLDRLAEKFPTLFGIGLDLSSEMLRQARAKKRYGSRLIFVRGNAESLPFADCQFQAVFNTISFLHYPAPEKVLAEVKRVLSPGGYFYLVDLTFWGNTQRISVNLGAGIMRFYPPKVREQLGADAGLQCVGHYHLLGAVVLTIFKRSI